MTWEQRMAAKAVARKADQEAVERVIADAEEATEHAAYEIEKLTRTERCPEIDPFGFRCQLLTPHSRFAHEAVVGINDYGIMDCRVWGGSSLFLYLGDPENGDMPPYAPGFPRLETE